MDKRIERILDDEEKKTPRDPLTQHPHMIESRKHWDWEQSYYEHFAKHTGDKE